MAVGEREEALLSCTHTQCIRFLDFHSTRPVIMTYGLYFARLAQADDILDNEDSKNTVVKTGAGPLPDSRDISNVEAGSCMSRVGRRVTKQVLEPVHLVAHGGPHDGTRSTTQYSPKRRNLLASARK